jgi:hypothetical protein
MRSFVTGKTINKQVQLNNRLTTFTNPPIQTGDLNVTRDLYVAGNTHLNDLAVTGNTHLNDLDICGNLAVQGNVLSYGTIKATNYLPGQVVYVSMLSSSDLGQTVNPILVKVNISNFQIFFYNYTPKIATSYIIIEYQTKYTMEGSGADTIDARLKVNTDEISSTYQQWYNGLGGGSRSGAIFPIVGRYTNTNTTTKTIGVYLYNNSSEDKLNVNSDNSTWLKITEIGRI